MVKLTLGLHRTFQSSLADSFLFVLFFVFCCEVGQVGILFARRKVLGHREDH